MIGGLVEDVASVLNSFQECQWIGGTGSDVEADTNDVETQFFSQSEKLICRIHSSSKLETQAAQARGVISGDAQEELGSRIELLDLVKFICIVESHLFDSLAGSVAHIGVGFAWLSVDNVRRINTHLQDHINFGLRGTVETGAKLRQETEDLRVRVALDRYSLLARFRCSLQGTILP